MGGLNADQLEPLPPADRLRVIADEHQKEVDASGGTWGVCRECGHAWPCPTFRWATYDGITLNCSWDLDECAMHQHEHP